MKNGTKKKKKKTKPHLEPAQKHTLAQQNEPPSEVSVKMGHRAAIGPRTALITDEMVA